MGRSNSDRNNCRKHPKHKNSPGVCPYCLKERLVHLSSPSFSFLNLACSTSASSTLFYSSESDLSSLAESPIHEKIQNANIMFLKDDKQLGDALPIKRGEPLLKSRSLIHVIGRKNELGDEDRRKLRLERGNKEKMDDKEEKKEKKASFWSKILRGGLRRDQEKGEKSWILGHSRTLKEHTSAKWVPFA